MKSRAFLGAFVLAVVVASASAVFGIWPFGRYETAMWLEKIGLPEGAAYVGKPDISELDGSSPEMLLQEVAMDGDPENIKAAFKKLCIAAGLGEPEAASVNANPDVLCESRPGTSSVSFIVTTDCSAKPCKVFLDVRRFSF